MLPREVAASLRRIPHDVPRRHPRQFCKTCGQHRSVVGDLSTRGKCLACGERLRQENAGQLIAHNGPWFEHWRRRGASGYGAVLVDDLIDLE